MTEHGFEAEERFDQESNANQARRSEGALAGQHMVCGPAPAMPSQPEADQIDGEIRDAELRYEQSERDSLAACYFTVYDQAPRGLFDLDAAASIIEVNLAGALLLGTLRARLLGHSFSEYVELSSRAAFKQFARAVLETRAAGRCELDLMRVGGTPFHALLQGNRLHEQDEKGMSWRIVILGVEQAATAP
jgi:PAS domain-containing protein